MEIKDILFYYVIIFDENKERTLKESKHLHHPLLGDIAAALTYCLHLPRTGFDLIETPEALFLEGGSPLQHEIYLISSNPTQKEMDQLSFIRPTLYIIESSSYEAGSAINHEYPSILGCVRIDGLSEELLYDQWNKLSNEVVSLIPQATKLNYITHLFGKDQISALPNLFLTNQLSNSVQLVETLNENHYSFEIRAQIMRYEKAKFMLYYDLGKNLDDLPNERIDDAIPKIAASIGYPLVLTLPGGPNKRLSYGSISKSISEEEDDLINFLGYILQLLNREFGLRANALMKAYSFYYLCLKVISIQMRKIIDSLEERWNALGKFLLKQ